MELKISDINVNVVIGLKPELMTWLSSLSNAKGAEWPDTTPFPEVVVKEAPPQPEPVEEPKAKKTKKVTEKPVEPVQTSPVVEAEPKITIEEIRVIAAKAQAEGLGENVKKMLTSMKANKLSELDPKHYWAFKTQLEVMLNGKEN